MANQPFDQRLAFDIELFLIDPDDPDPQLVGVLTNEPVIILFKNQTNEVVFLADNDGDANGTTMVAGEEIIVDCRANNGHAVNMGFPTGTPFYITVEGATGRFCISVLYAK